MDEDTLAAQHSEKRPQTHFLCAGEMSTRKGYDLVLNAFARLKALGLEAKLTMAGAGPGLKALRHQASALGIAGETSFPGYVPHENMASLYLDAAVFLAPGIAPADGPSDGVPSALAEAMAFFVPVIASDLPGQVWMLDGGRAGILVPQGDEAKLAEAMERLCHDREERARLGAAGQERAAAVAREASVALAQLFAPLVARRRQSL
jgi:glycosyltransferase involved in cell wall biosynthesis